MTDGYIKGDICYRCLKESGETRQLFGKDVLIADMRMVFCAICGNKRCPHATDHRLECTHSNEPGQAGSNYESAQIIKKIDTKYSKALGNLAKR